MMIRGLLALSVFYGVSGSSAPAWGWRQSLTAALVGTDCIRVSWPVPSVLGSPPVGCYDVQATNVSHVTGFWTVQNCTRASEFVQCNLKNNTRYTFRVFGVGPSGLRSNGSTIGPIQLDWISTLENITTITSPAWNETTFVTGSLPNIQVTVTNNSQGYQPILVGTLVNRCQLDNTTFNVLTRPLVEGDANYTAVGSTPLGLNAAPLFTSTFALVNNATGVYELKTTETQPTTGAYSLIVYSLEAGGLWGQYWQNPRLTGSPSVSRKDLTMDVSFTGVQARQVSVRWTGFIESKYGEMFTFIVDSTGSGNLWIDDVLVIGQGRSSGRAMLKESNPAARKFSRIRVEYIQLATVTGNSWFRLQWISASQPLQVIPVNSLFRSMPVQGTVKSINIVVGLMDVSKTIVGGLESGSTTAGVSGVLSIIPRDTLGTPIYNDTSIQFTAKFNNTEDARATPVSFSSYMAPNGSYYIPFTITTAGLYSVNITDDVTGLATPESPFLANVDPGPPHQVSAVVVDLSTTVAGGTSIIMFSLFDKNGNDVSFVQASPSKAFLSVQWQSDPVTAARLGADDDVSARSESFGVTFTNATFEYSAASFNYIAKIKITRAGMFTFALGIQDGAAAYTDVFEVRAGTVSQSIQAVVVGYPNISNHLPSATVNSFRVQLRDNWGNALVSVPTVVETVAIFVSSGDTGTCSPSVSFPGQYLCEISPSIAADGLGLFITVGGVPATLQGARGPWIVDIDPSIPAASACEVSGIFKTDFMVGAVVNASLVLKDGFGNLVYANESEGIDVRARLLDSSDNTFETLDNSTFAWDPVSETVKIPLVLATRSQAPLFLAVFVGGTRVPYNSPAIRVSEGLISASGTDCSPVKAFAAGTSATVSCSLRDYAGNAVNAINAFIELDLSHATNLSVATLKAVATPVEDYEIVSPVVTVAGVYWAYILVAQPDGLMVSYFSQGSIVGSPLIDVRGGGTSAPAVFYSAIEEYLYFNSSGPLLKDGVAVTRVVWEGKIRGPVTDTVTFRLACDGGAIVSFDGVLAVSMIDNSGSINTTFTLAMTEDVYVDLYVEYIPLVSQAALSLEWKYTGSVPDDFLVVPPSYLYALLNNGGTYQSITVSAGAVSVISTVQFPPSLVQQKQDFIIIQAIDQYGNAHTSSPSCLFVTGIAPACLFLVGLVANDGSVFGTPIDMGDGRLKVPVTFANDGPKRVSVKLQTASGVYADIIGSPFSVTVNP